MSTLAGIEPKGHRAHSVAKTLVSFGDEISAAAFSFMVIVVRKMYKNKRQYHKTTSKLMTLAHLQPTSFAGFLSYKRFYCINSGLKQ